MTLRCLVQMNFWKTLSRVSPTSSSDYSMNIWMLNLHFHGHLKNKIIAFRRVLFRPIWWNYVLIHLKYFFLKDRLWLTSFPRVKDHVLRVFLNRKNQIFISNFASLYFLGFLSFLIQAESDHFLKKNKSNFVPMALSSLYRGQCEVLRILKD